ncbi:hypothetical protein B4Q13_18980, partial [Lacticaseibacillus rhamnosus]
MRTRAIVGLLEVWRRGVGRQVRIDEIVSLGDAAADRPCARLTRRVSEAESGSEVGFVVLGLGKADSRDRAHRTVNFGTF